MHSTHAIKLTIALLLLLLPTAWGQKLSISIFNETPLASLLLTPARGHYRLIMPDTTISVGTDQLVYLTRRGDSIAVRDAQREWGLHKQVALVGQTGHDLVRIKPLSPSLPARLYDDNMNFYIDFHRLMSINLIEQEKYVSAVVEAEAGPNRHPEFYRAQALIVRTYIYANLHRHSDEGFNLCDGVHCQAYKGRSESDRIFQATNDTRDLIIVDAQRKPIAAAFHANCGGHTANSEDVWVAAMPYLVGVPDRFCSGGRGFAWERRIPISQWRKFLAEQGVDTLRLSSSDMSLTQKTRQSHYVVQGVRIPTTKVRERFGLKSAWFNVTPHRHEVRLSGRGYGHGVGLCQEGAMAMANKGWSYERIIAYYYRDVSIVSIDDLQPETTAELPTPQNQEQPDSLEPIRLF